MFENRKDINDPEREKLEQAERAWMDYVNKRFLNGNKTNAPGVVPRYDGFGWRVEQTVRQQ